MREEKLITHEKKNKKCQSGINDDSPLLAPYKSEDPLFEKQLLLVHPGKRLFMEPVLVTDYRLG